MLAAVALELGDFGLIAGLLAAFGGLGVRLIQGNIKALAARIDRIEDRIAEVEKTKTDKHDWARETLRARSKMGIISEQMTRLAANLDNNLGIATSINRLAEELGKRNACQGCARTET